MESWGRGGATSMANEDDKQRQRLGMMNATMAIFLESGNSAAAFDAAHHYDRLFGAYDPHACVAQTAEFKVGEQIYLN